MTTNNLIGYDPLAWMDGAELDEEEAATPVVVEPAKKATKSKAKTKTAPVEEVAVAQEPTETEIVAQVEPETDVEEASDTIEVEVSIDEDGDVEISVEATEDTELSVEVSIENHDDNVIEASAEEIIEDVAAQEEIEGESVQEEDIAVAQEEHIEEAPVEALAEPHIDLESESTIKNVAQLYSTIKNSLAAHDVIEINAADVATIDTATLQLLVSLKKDAPNLGKTVDIIYPSERFLESAKLLGLLEILGV